MCTFEFENQHSDDGVDIPEFIFYGTNESNEVYTEILEEDVQDRDVIAGVIREFIASECHIQGIPQETYCLIAQNGRILQEDCDEPLNDLTFQRIVDSMNTKESFEIRKTRF